MDKRLVRITWRDASDPHEKQPWYSEEEIDEFSEEETIVVSVGWIKSETAKYITLVADYAPNPDGSYTWSRPTKIPPAMVLKIEDLT